MLTDGDLHGVRVIVTDAETRLGLCVIRALGQAGCKVTALSSEQLMRRVIGFSSRFVSERYLLPDGDYEQTLLSTLERLAARHEVLVPVSAWSLAIVAGRASLLESKIHLYIPPAQAIELATDKAATTRIAKESGIPVPETYHILNPATIEEWAKDTRATFPLVVKFSDDQRSDFWNPADRYRIVKSVTELTNEYRRMHQIAPYPLVQEYIEGGGFGFFAITDAAGDPLVTFCHRRLREYPISGGPSTLCESISDGVLVEYGTRLLKRLRWKGVAMVEFKHDRRRQEYKFLEVNPRFWGSLPLAIRCGVNFPVYQVQMALGMRPPVERAYPIGRKMRFFFPDLCAVLARWKKEGGISIFMKYLGELMDFSIKDGFFAMDDPKPLLRYLLNQVGR